MIIVRQKRKNGAQFLKCNRSAVPQMRERGLRAIARLCKQTETAKRAQRDCEADAVLLNGYEK